MGDSRIRAGHVCDLRVYCVQTPKWTVCARRLPSWSFGKRERRETRRDSSLSRPLSCKAQKRECTSMYCARWGAGGRSVRSAATRALAPLGPTGLGRGRHRAPLRPARVRRRVARRPLTARESPCQNRRAPRRALPHCAKRARARRGRAAARAARRRPTARPQRRGRRHRARDRPVISQVPGHRGSPGTGARAYYSTCSASGPESGFVCMILSDWSPWQLM